jgi:Outer membrane protein beta-barrel domain
MAPAKHPGMKERNIYGEDLERQLKDKVDQYKMYPSDRVWNEVHSSLHSRKRKFVVGMGFLIGGMLFLAGTQLILPSKKVSTAGIAKVSTPSKPAPANNLHNFTAGSFAIPETMNSGEHNNLGILPVNSLSLAVSPEYVSIQQSPEENMTEYAPETIQSAGRLKPVQITGENSPAKSSATPVVAEFDETLTSTSNPTINKVSSELVAEMSTRQLTHIRNDRLSWEIYIAPTLNTHYLNGLNYQTMTQVIPASPIMVVHVANVNGFVDNTPVMGYVVGGNILYRISKNISLKAGLEFSFSRYYIKAYNPAPGQATTVLSSYLGYLADSITNFNSTPTVNKNPQHYQNRYYQLSVPIGVDMKVAGKNKLQFHMGATLQPSYLLNTDAYVLTDDYSSYTKDPQAFRRWNLIAGAEAYISYGTGKIRWELGPQVRYQIFSTYRNSYPLQENMLNYGIRIGISKSIW